MLITMAGGAEGQGTEVSKTRAANGNVLQTGAAWKPCPSVMRLARRRRPAQHHRAQGVTRRRSCAQAYDVLIFGDSITEAFLGTSMGFDDPSYDENKRAFQELIASRYRAGVRSMAGARGSSCRCGLT